MGFNPQLGPDCRTPTKISPISTVVSILLGDSSQQKSPLGGTTGGRGNAAHFADSIWIGTESDRHHSRASTTRSLYTNIGARVQPLLWQLRARCPGVVFPCVQTNLSTNWQQGKENAPETANQVVSPRSVKMTVSPPRARFQAYIRQCREGPSGSMSVWVRRALDLLYQHDFLRKQN